MFTPTAIITALETILPASRDFTYVASIHRYGQSPSMGRSKNARARSSISVHSRDTWLLLIPLIPVACRPRRPYGSRAKKPGTGDQIRRSSYTTSRDVSWRREPDTLLTLYLFCPMALQKMLVALNPLGANCFVEVKRLPE